jgi:hypothetical protein
MTSVKVLSLLCLTLGLEVSQGWAADELHVQKSKTIDSRMLKHAPELLFQLRELNLQTVGVLPFRFQKGDAPATFNAGPLNTLLPVRLENELIMSNEGPDKKPMIGIVRDVGPTAARVVGAWYHKTAEMRKLFDVAYPHAWESKKVKVDGLLTGLVKLNRNLETVSVTIELISSKSVRVNGKDVDPFKRVEILTIDDIVTDRDLLRTAGLSFVLPRGTAKKTTTAERDRLAVRSVLRREGPPVSIDDIAGLTLEIYFDDSKQDLKQDPQESAAYFVPSPKEGQKVKLVVKHNNKIDDRIGFVLSIDGRSTFQQQTGDSKDCKPWLISPGKSYTFQGFAEDAQTEVPWKVLSDEESAKRAGDFGDKAGLITLDVFQKGGKTMPEEVTLSTYGIRARELKKNPVKSFDDLSARLFRAAGVKKPLAISSLGLLEVDQGSERIQFRTDYADFPNPIQVGSLSIRYYSARSAAALQLSKD